MTHGESRRSSRRWRTTPASASRRSRRNPRPTRPRSTPMSSGWTTPPPSPRRRTTGSRGRLLPDDDRAGHAGVDRAHVLDRAGRPRRVAVGPTRTEVGGLERCPAGRGHVVVDAVAVRPYDRLPAPDGHAPRRELDVLHLHPPRP